MLILRIKQAQCALADGRLDEAFEQARQADVQAHREGQALLARLVPALRRRGEEHLAAGRLAEAQADCQKAARLGGNLPEVAGLRSAIAEATVVRQRADRRVAQIAAAAREHLDGGRLSMGEHVLAAARGDGAPAAGTGLPGADRDRLDFLQRELAARRAEAAKALDLAAGAMEREDLGLAADELLRARGFQAPNSRLAELTSRLLSAAAGRIGAFLNDGRLDQAQSVLDRIGPLADPRDGLGQYHRFLGDCLRACERFQGRRHREAATILRRLSLSQPGAAWLSAAAGQLEQAAGQVEAVLSGPLGLLTRGDATPFSAAGNGGVSPLHGTPQAEKNGDATLFPAAGNGVASPLPMKFLMLVDGVGSYLVARGERVTIGPVSSSSRPDLGLVADPNLPTIAIERVEEDYFLRAGGGVCVNDKPATNRLLVGGDVISLSAGHSKCRLRFGLPNPASSSAVLTLSGVHLPRADVRQVVLLGREMVLGPGSAAHVRADDLEGAVTLHVRDGRLLCGGGPGVTVDGRPVDERVGLPIGAAIRIGPLSLVLAGL